MKLIDKNALVAEIERRLEAISSSSNENNRKLAAIRGAQQYELINLALFLNTLEVKEVDFEEEIKDYIEQHKSELSGYFDIRRIARHFFGLGLKSQKGE